MCFWNSIRTLAIILHKYQTNFHYYRLFVCASFTSGPPRHTSRGRRRVLDSKWDSARYYQFWFGHPEWSTPGCLSALGQESCLACSLVVRLIMPVLILASEIECSLAGNSRDRIKNTLSQEQRWGRCGHPGRGSEQHA